MSILKVWLVGYIQREKEQWGEAKHWNISYFPELSKAKTRLKYWEQGYLAAGNMKALFMAELTFDPIDGGPGSFLMLERIAYKEQKVVVYNKQDVVSPTTLKKDYASLFEAWDAPPMPPPTNEPNWGELFDTVNA